MAFQKKLFIFPAYTMPPALSYLTYAVIQNLYKTFQEYHRSFINPIIPQIIPPSQRFVCVCVCVCKSTHSVAFLAALGELILVAWHTDHLVISGDEALVADGLFAHHTAEAFFMPLLALVLKLLHTWIGKEKK